MRLHLRDGRFLSYADFGSGPPVFHLPGYPGSRMEARLLESRLEGYRVISADLPGVGSSDPHPGRTLADTARDLAELADALGLERFAVEGLSAGGPYALACAWAIPERLTACAVVSGQGPVSLAPPGVPLKTRLAWKAYRSSWWHKLSAGPLGKMGRDPELMRSFLSRLARSLCPRDQVLLDSIQELMVQAVLDAFAPGAQGVLQGTHLVFEGRPWGFQLSDLRFSPIHLWHGEQDALVPVSLARATAAAIPGCQARFLPGEGHFAILDHAQEIYTLLGSSQT